MLTVTVQLTQEQTEAATLDAVKASEQATEQAKQSWQSAMDAKRCLATCAELSQTFQRPCNPLRVLQSRQATVPKVQLSM